METPLPEKPYVYLKDIVCQDITSSVQREWLVTNGIGGYAMGTVSGVQTRGYHGLLLAALNPPLGRTLLLSSLEETVTAADVSTPLFTSNAQSQDTPAKGFESINHFQLNGTTPTWTYALGSTRLEKKVWMEPGANTTYICYTLLAAESPISLDIAVRANYRDHHARSTNELSLIVDAVSHGIRISDNPEHVPYYVRCASEEITRSAVSQEEHYLAAEADRGTHSADTDCLVGTIHTTMKPGDAVTIVASVNEEADLDGAQSYQRRLNYEADVIARSPEVARNDNAARQLLLAADQFIVTRSLADTSTGRSILAGYPWFGDWGRDTMISLPGLLIETGRSDLASQVLRTFSQFVDQGMLPNRFPDVSDTPEYNTVDATLWYFQAIYAYYVQTQDEQLIHELFPILEDIITWHIRGTRHCIRVDPVDQLLYAGELGTQLTWMDAKYGDWVVTPRIGKPVEINALWYNALRSMASFARVLHRPGRAYRYDTQADQVRKSFDRFWNENTGYCFDVIDGLDGAETLLRPNQLFAVSLPHSPLTAEKQKAVVDACEKSLLTPFGLRSLAPFEHGYAGQYEGDNEQRDSTYHQGTVWAWLIGPFVDAHLRVYHDNDQAMRYIEPLSTQHLLDFGIGSVSEVFDADPPYTGRGCPEQAWSVAELLRIWLHLNDS